MIKEPLVSIIIPARDINDYLRQAISKILELDYQDFEILVLPDGETKTVFEKTRIIPLNAGPAEKRDLAAKQAKGEILAFLDDDAYPAQDWLKNAVGCFENLSVVAVCGPGVTPKEDSVWQKASGWVSASFLGGGPARFRFLPIKRREVVDFPSMNFLVRKADFEAVNGFDSNFWPGEDTKFCLDLAGKLGKKIIYDPKVLVYHHRRALFLQHLKQNGNFGLHRGYFARILPETSKKLWYFIPSAFVLFLIFGFVLGLILPPVFSIYIFILSVYIILLILSAVQVYLKEQDLKISLLLMPGIFLTHIWYGLRFLQGFFLKELKR